MSSVFRISAVFTLAVSLTLTACGGGGASNDLGAVPDPIPTPPAPTTAEGLWSGTSSSARTLTGLVLDDGSYWVFYSSPSNSGLIAGVIQGSGTALNGSFSSSNARDYNFEGSGVLDATVSASYVAKQTFNGSINYSAPSSTVSFSTSYRSSYEQTPSLAAVAGTYVGLASVAGGSEVATVQVSTTGVLTGAATGGCQFSGTMTPRSVGAFTLSLTFSGGSCLYGSSTLTGIAHYDTATKRLYSAALNGNRTSAFVFAATRP